jgi:hypothetical protein
MRYILILFSSAILIAGLHAQNTPVLYENQFDKSDKFPDDILVLDGIFEIKEEAGNKFAELPGAPLDTYGFMFGPSQKENIEVTARIFGTGKGRRFPTFAVGLNGVGGYKLQVSPAKKLVELYKGDEVKQSSPLEWKSGAWTFLKLTLRKSGETEWKLQGYVWNDAPAPKDPALTWVEKDQPSAGKPSVWGSPYAGTPLRFDDLLVKRAD